MKKALIFIGAILLFIPVYSLAATIMIPNDQPTIQAGIDASVNGDTVLLADGTYTGIGNYNIDFNGKSITVKSSGGAENCIIDCQQLGRGFLSYNGETVTFEGLTIKNGDAGEHNGGAIYFHHSSSSSFTDCIFASNSANWGGAVYYERSSFSSSFTNCTFTSNSANWGGAVYYFFSSSSLTNCTFISNSSSSNGGAIFFNHSSPLTTVTNCTFASNSANWGGAVYYEYSFFSSFTNCTFTSNSAVLGGAIHVKNSSSTSFSSFINCTITLNEASVQGGAIWCEIPLAPEDSITIKNCILWGNISPEGSEIYENEKPLIITYSNIQGGHTGSGNINENPLFINADNDYHLQPTSPCIDTGTAEGVPSDDLDGNYRPIGSGYDIGAYEFQTTIVIDELVANPYSGELPLTVDFICTAHDDVSTITEYRWEFEKQQLLEPLNIFIPFLVYSM